MIADLFMFHNELDLLEIRLHTLAPIVDRFILVESDRTIQGHAKPFVFTENRERFREFLPRISVIRGRWGSAPKNPWSSEHRHRDALWTGLVTLDSADFAILSDLDEIPRPECLKAAVQSGAITTLRADVSYYWLNLVSDEAFYGPRVGPVRLLIRKGSMMGIRKFFGAIVPHGAWHFSFMGGVQQIRQKLLSYAHREFARPPFTDETHIEKCLLGRPFRFRVVDPASHLPSYVVQNRGRFASMILEAPSEAACQSLAGVGRTDPIPGALRHP
jgi:beta-1,4-mannosyl-glycoprotein beta-1,4-N-acetylglucosaminyltransferase